MNEIPQPLMDDLAAMLQEKYPEFEAVRCGRDRIEVRALVRDIFAEAFPVDDRPDIVPDRVKAPPAEKPAPKRKETAQDGFGIAPVDDFSDMLAEGRRKRLREIIDRHQGILTSTRDGSGVWHKTCREVARLSEGTFGSWHRWNGAWYEHLKSHGTSPKFLCFTAGTDVLDAIDRTLDYIETRWNEGARSFWWPQDGARKSLLEFLVTGSRDGSETSPFIEVYFWHMTWMGYRESLPQQAREIVDREARKTGYTGDALVSMWSCAAQVVKWYNEHRETLMRVQANRSRLVNSWDLLRLVCDWNVAQNFHAHPLRWLRPEHKLWPDFVNWAATNHGVNLSVRVR